MSQDHISPLLQSVPMASETLSNCPVTFLLLAPTSTYSLIPVKPRGQEKVKPILASGPLKMLIPCVECLLNPDVTSSDCPY